MAGKLKDLINKHIEIQLDINFIKTCKREDLIPTFVEKKMLNKHDQNRKIKKQIRDIKFQSKPSLTLTLYNTLLHWIDAAIKS